MLGQPGPVEICEEAAQHAFLTGHVAAGDVARRAARCAVAVSPHPGPEQTEPTRMRPKSWHARTHQPSSSAVMFTKMRFAKAAIQSVLSARVQGHSTATRLRTSWGDGVLLALRFKARSARPFDGDTGCVSEVMFPTAS